MSSMPLQIRRTTFYTMGRIVNKSRTHKTMNLKIPNPWTHAKMTYPTTTYNMSDTYRTDANVT